MKNFLKSVFFAVYPSAPEVIITPGGARFGNLLYFFLRAHIYEQEGKVLKILYTKHMDDIVTYFPSLKKFMITEDEVTFYHKKDRSNQFYQVFGTHFKDHHLDAFIKDHLLSSEKIKAYLNRIPKPHLTDLTINIRRGDFYQHGNVSIYGYDQVAFVKFVFENHLSNKAWNKIKIVSDDMEWCKREFLFLRDYTDTLHFPSFSDEKIIESFLEVVQSRNLIITNSTFSFWASYISNYKYGSAETTICPIFGARGTEEIDIYQNNPKWQMIKDFNFNNVAFSTHKTR